MNYADIKRIDVANGLGVRVSLFVSGCSHHCKGCFNEETWDFNYGKPFTEAEIEQQRSRFCSVWQVIEEAELVDEYEAWKEANPNA